MWTDRRRKTSSKGDGGSVDRKTSVGLYLKSERESQGQDLAHVSQNLRIHRSYLQAIEEGDIDGLPGPTYAVGFVRSYADYLGLDGNNLTERFKDEGKVLKRCGELVFPSPLAEGQVPSLALVLFAAVMLLAAYGGWLFISSPKSGVDERTPVLSERLRLLVDSDGQGDRRSASKDTLAPDEKADVGFSIEEQTRADHAATLVTPAKSVTEALREENGVLAKDAASVGTKFIASPETRGSSGIPKTDLLTADLAMTNVKTLSGDNVDWKLPNSKFVESKPDLASLTFAAPIVMELPKEDKPKEDKPRIYGDAEAGSRIMITALVDSWVEVSDSDGELLLTRVLREGDSYHVPDRTGLIMLTGNAGGLEIAVDRVKVPKIGRLGSVLRHVRLEPNALKGGTAHTQ